MRRFLPLLVAAALPFTASAAGSGGITVAAAANLRGTLDEVVAGFRARSPGAEVTVSYGASGTFFAQIQQRAPYDVFLSAEDAMPRKLVDAGKGDGAAFTYALGKLVIWVPRESKVDIEKQGARALLDASVKYIAIGNPAVAPYGVAAESALRAADVYDALKDRLVRGQNIQQAATFAETGNTQAAFLPLSLAMVPPMSMKGRYVLVPSGDYQPIVQAGVVLKESAQPAVANGFASYLLGPEGRAVLERHGYGVPGIAKR